MGQNETKRDGNKKIHIGEFLAHSWVNEKKAGKWWA